MAQYGERTRVPTTGMGLTTLRQPAMSVLPSTIAGSAAGVGGKILERVHSVSYHATEHKLLLDVKAEQTVGSVKTENVGNITIKNSGGTPAFAILAYRL